MTTTRDTDANTHTIADAWASSPLGQPEGDVRYGFATTGGGDAVVGVDQSQPLATRAPRTAALAFGLVAGAALDVVSLGYTEPVQTTIVVPGSGVVQNAPSHAVVATPSGRPMTIRPDWVCEVISPSTARIDREGKMRIYARVGVGYLWILDPLARTLEIYRLVDRRWEHAITHAGDAPVRAVPFETVELTMQRWWLED